MKVKYEVITRDITDKMEQEISTFIEGLKKTLDLENTIPLIVFLMEQVSQFTNLKGGQKKDVVISTVQKYIQTTDQLSSKQKDELMYFIQNTVPQMIDYFVLVSKQVFKFTVKHKKNFMKCLPC